MLSHRLATAALGLAAALLLPRSGVAQSSASPPVELSLEEALALARQRAPALIEASGRVAEAQGPVAGEIPNVSPRARETAGEGGLDWKSLSLSGTGFEGMVVERDIRDHAQMKDIPFESAGRTGVVVVHDRRRCRPSHERR